MKELIVLLNFNEYQGGGETLLVRFAEYLRNNRCEFLIFCTANGFIHNELRKRDFSEYNFSAIDLNYNLLYQSDSKKIYFINNLFKRMGKDVKINIVSFCLRDLYTAFFISQKTINCSISHLVLHVQDDLFLGQTIWNKFLNVFFNIQNFTQHKNIKSNRLALSIINKNQGLISMTQVINDYWYKTFGLVIPKSNVVPLPSFRLLPGVEYQTLNNKRIIWIGRIVDFKIPSIIAMIEFVSKNKDYSMTIVGDGDRKIIFNYVNLKALDISRIHFVGEVPYQELGDVIKGHSIGYGMGTSLIELAMHRIPVIVALASFNHVFFTSPICGGIFYNQPKGCDGSDLIFKSQSDIKCTISEMISIIEIDYLNQSKYCYEFAETEFAENINFKLYLDIIRQSKKLDESQKHIVFPHVSLFRKLMLNLYLNSKRN